METEHNNQQKITPFLWFDNNAEEAMNFYTSIFKDSKIGKIHRLPTDGSMMTASFHLNGQEFMVLNAGPQFKFNHAISFFVKCKTQEEVDHFWEKLSEGGQKEQCGWLKDKFGLSWQIVPNALGELMYNKDPQKSKKVMEAMMKMTKIEIAELEAAYNS